MHNPSTGLSHGPKDPLQYTQVHLLASTQIQQILTSHVAKRMHPPHCQETLSCALWYSPAAGLNCLKVPWNKSMEEQLESPSPKELGCFLISLKNASRKFVLGKKQHWYTSFPAISARTQCCTMHKTEAACGHLFGSRFLFFLGKKPLILTGDCASHQVLSGRCSCTPTCLPSSHCCFFSACPLFR